MPPAGFVHRRAGHAPADGKSAKDPCADVDRAVGVELLVGVEVLLVPRGKGSRRGDALNVREEEAAETQPDQGWQEVGVNGRNTRGRQAGRNVAGDGDTPIFEIGEVHGGDRQDDDCQGRRKFWEEPLRDQEQRNA